MSDYSGTIFLCTFCGDKCKGKFCATCSSSDQRHKKIIEQFECEKQRGKKATTMFGTERVKLLKTYKIVDWE